MEWRIMHQEKQFRRSTWHHIKCQILERTKKRKTAAKSLTQKCWQISRIMARKEKSGIRKIEWRKDWTYESWLIHDLTFWDKILYVCTRFCLVPFSFVCTTRFGCVNLVESLREQTSFKSINISRTQLSICLLSKPSATKIYSFYYLFVIFILVYLLSSVGATEEGCPQ